MLFREIWGFPVYVWMVVAFIVACGITYAVTDDGDGPCGHVPLDEQGDCLAAWEASMSE